jgi:hypothetical protein
VILPEFAQGGAEFAHGAAELLTRFSRNFGRGHGVLDEIAAAALLAAYVLRKMRADQYPEQALIFDDLSPPCETLNLSGR